MTILYLSTRFKEKVRFITYYGPLNAIKSKWKVPASQKPRGRRTQDWFDDAENLSTAALHKIIVGNKFQPPSNENKITRLGAARPDVPQIYITKDTKLTMFQFNINRYIIYTKDKLRRANLILTIGATSAKQKSMQPNTFFFTVLPWWHYNTRKSINLNDLT